MSARRPCDALIETVVDTGLCTRCGTCVGCCPYGNIVIEDPWGECLPSAGDTCDSCGLCLSACPGARVDFHPIERTLFGREPEDRLLGTVLAAWLAHASDREARMRGASGGVVTTLLEDLLGRGSIDGAVVWSNLADSPWRAAGEVVTDAEGVRRSAQSRYHLSPMNSALALLPEDGGRYALAGLPCHIHGLRKLQAAGWRRGEQIGPVIGIYCGNNLYFEATRRMLRKIGAGEPEDIDRLAYRDGEWPGEFAARLRDGSERRISKLDFNQAIPFYVNRRCLFCTDLTAELSDISVGDGWAKEGSGTGGWSLVLARTAEGLRIVEDAVSAGIINAVPVGLDEARRMHSHAFDLKKTGAFLRLGLWRRWGVSVPSYDLAPPRTTAARRIAEWFVSAQFRLCSSGPGRALFAVLPARSLGPLFRGARRLWMRLTGGESGRSAPR